MQTGENDDRDRERERGHASIKQEMKDAFASGALQTDQERFYHTIRTKLKPLGEGDEKTKT